jgi:hypothetical protein
MAKSASKPIFDGATLSPKLKPDGDTDDQSLSLPIGKETGQGGVAVARAYKHAAGKSSTYDPQVVDMIYHMSREGHFSDSYVSEFVKAKLAAERDMTRNPPPATWDQLVFLSANLTRLVIDPYREKCDSQVTIGHDCKKPIVLEWPIILSGADFGKLPDPLPMSLLKAAAEAGLAISTNASWKVKDQPSAQQMITVDISQPLPDLSNARAVELTTTHASLLTQDNLATIVKVVRDATDAQIPVGIVAPAFNASNVIDRIVDLDIDFCITDGQWTQDQAPTDIFPELVAAPAIHVLADTIERLRYHRKEETIQVIYRGGIRGGADAGKALCLGASAACLGLSAAIGMGFKITKITDKDHLLKQLSAPCDSDAVTHNIYNFAKSVVMEVTMLARACGKSSVTNMEPEDLRALTIAISAATGIPLTGKDMNFRTIVR